MSNIKAIIFDCFGVLYTDTKSMLFEDLSEQSASDLWSLFEQNDYGYIDYRQFLEGAAAIVGKTPSELEVWINQSRHLNQSFIDFIQTELKAHYKIGLLTNMGKGRLDEFFPESLRKSLFDQIVVSGEEGVVKPNVRAYQLIAERLGLKVGECLMVDDMESNCAGADAAGMQAIQFTSNAKLRADLELLLKK